MNYPEQRHNKEREIMEQNVGYAQGSVREYLNIKRTSKDKCCTVIFCLYLFTFIIIAGIGFFFGNFSNIGTFVVAGNQCSQFLSYSSTNNIYACDLVGCSPPSTYPYLQKVCVTSEYTVIDSSLSTQISIYSFNLTLPLMVYMNIGLVIGLILLFSLVICCEKLIYLYIFTAFGLLLGFAFYLLTTVKNRVDSLTAQYALDTAFPSSQLIAQEQTIQPLAYILLAAYLVLFPVILFSPAKIKMGVRILSQMYGYFQNNFTVIIFSLLMTLLIYGGVFTLGFLLLNFATDGSPVSSDSSFFYLYEQINLIHPAALVFFYIGVYWLFAAVGSWHQYVIASSVMQWYFEDGGKLQPVRKGMKRGWYNLGSQCLDAILMPIQWLTLFLYSVCKMDSETVEQYEHQHHEDCLCMSSFIYKFRQLITQLYIKINRGSPLAGTLTNNNFVESCQLAAVTFADRKHRFFNIGGTITLFLSLFVTLTFLFTNYLVLYSQNYDVFPARVNSLQLQVVLAIFLGLAVGQILGNTFGTSIDALLFFFLKQKSGGEAVSELQIKKMLQQLYSQQQQVARVDEMYELESDTE